MALARANQDCGTIVERFIEVTDLKISKDKSWVIAARTTKS